MTALRADRRLMSRASVLLVLLALALALPGTARADDAAVLYDPANVAQVDLTLSEEAKQSLLAEPSTYVPATFRLNVADRAFGPKPAQVSLVPPAAAAVAGFAAGPFRAPRLLPRRLTARVSPGADVRPPYRFTTSGSLLAPAGVGRASACEGRVAVRIRAGRRTIAMGGAFLRRNCSFSSSVRFKDPSVFAGRRTLTVQVRFRGNDALLPRSAAPRTVAVRRGEAGL